MITLRRSQERGHANHGWLDSFHSFSFADYYDPEHMGYGPLRVINEDVVAPGGGFGMHPHHDMEIITYIISGSLEHRDSLGNSGVIRPGDVQRMTAGTGITHSEFNPSASEPVHLLQIWIRPDRKGHEPSYEQKTLAPATADAPLRLIASSNGREGSVRINQSTDLYALQTSDQRSVQLPDMAGKRGWIQVISGKLRVANEELAHGDALSFVGIESLTIESLAGSEALIFVMPE